MSIATIYHIPVCPFCQRLEILLSLKGQEGAVDFEVVDITKPRDPALLAKTRGTTALPVMDVQNGAVLKESLILMDYLDERVEGGLVRRRDPLEHAVEAMMIAKEGSFTAAGYLMVMNRDRDRTQDFLDKLLAVYRDMNDFLLVHNPDGVFLFDEFGLAEAVFTPFFQRFWFLDYYEAFELPSGAQYDRVRKWRQACLEHPAAQQVTKEEIVKVYYDYAVGAGNGALPEGRSRSSFVFEPDWRSRPWPPKNKYDAIASDEELGLV